MLLTGRSRTRRIGSLTTMLTLLLVAAGLQPVAAAAPSITFRVDVDGTCVAGTKPNNAFLMVKLLRVDGLYDPSDGNYGETRTDWYACFSQRIHFGNKIRATVSADHSQDRTVTVPELTISADRVTNKVSGHGPAGTRIYVRYSDCNMTGCGGYQQRACIVDNHGRWSKDLTSVIDLQGADRVQAEYDSPSGDAFETEAHVPYLRLSPPNQAHVECQPAHAVSLTLRTATGALRASKTLGDGGACASRDGTFRRNGHVVKYSIGNIIRSDLASDAKIVWPFLSATATAGTQSLSISCLPNAPFVAEISHHLPTLYFHYSATTGADGRHAAPSSGWTFASGDLLTVTCATAKGDQITFSAIVP